MRCDITKNTAKDRIIGSICVLSFVVASVYAFLSVFVSLEFPDTFFHAADYLYSGSLDTFRILNQGLFVLCIKLFGKSILGPEILNFLFYYLSFVLVYLVCCYPHKDCRMGGLFLVAVALSTLPINQITAFNGNSLTVFFLSCTLVSLYKSTDNLYWLIGVSFSVLCCALSRFPSLLLVPILMVVSPLILRGGKNYGLLCLALLFSCVSYIIINGLVAGDMLEFVSSFGEDVYIATDKNASDHSVSFLFSEYIHTLKDIVSIVKYLALHMIPLILSKFTRNRFFSAFLPILTIVSFIAMVIYRLSAGIGIWYPTHCLLMAVPLIMIFVLCVILLFAGDYVKLGFGIAMLLFSLCAPAGSGSGLLYMSVPLFVFVPFAFSMLKEQLSKADSEVHLMIVFSFVGLSFCSFLFVREGMQAVGTILFAFLLLTVYLAGVFKKRFIFCQDLICKMKRLKSYRHACQNRCCIVSVSLVLVVISVLSFVGTSGRLAKLGDYFQEKELKGMKTTEDCGRFVSEVMEDYRKVSRDNRVVFYGYNSSVFCYLTGIGRVSGSDFSQRENERNKMAFLNATADNPVVFICGENPAEPLLYSNDYYVWFVNALIEKGYSLDDKKQYYVLYPPHKS